MKNKDFIYTSDYHYSEHTGKTLFLLKTILKNVKSTCFEVTKYGILEVEINKRNK